MDNDLTPQSQKELDRCITAAVRRMEAFDPNSIMGMIGGSCIGGSPSPLMLCFRYETRAWMANPMGTTHGGMIATMFDNAIGSTAYTLSPYSDTAPTAELHISYLKPVPIDRAIQVRVYVEQAGRRMIRSRAEMRLVGDGDVLLATAFGVSCPKQGRHS